MADEPKKVAENAGDRYSEASARRGCRPSRYLK